MQASYHKLILLYKMIEFRSTDVLIMLTFFQSWSMLISRVNLLYQ